MVKIGINGFGRLGRLLLRICLDQCGKGTPDLPIVTIVNDPDLKPDHMGYLMKHDTFYGPYKREIIEMDNCIVVEGQRIEAVQVRKPHEIPWHQSGTVDYIVDTTGRNITCEAASRYLQDNIKGVVVTGCGDIPVFCIGINHTCYKPTMKTVSVGTPSLNCLTSMLRVLHEYFHIEKATATAIHPMNNTDRIIDDKSRTNKRKGRSAVYNFMPVHSGASGRYVGRILPELDGKLESTAYKVPVPCVGAVDLFACLKEEVSYEIVLTKFKEAAESHMRGVLRYCSEDTVSSDIIGDSHSCVICANAGLSLPKNCVKIFGWYDAEYAFAHRLYDMVKHISSRENTTK